VEFLERWLTHGAGGTCWPSSNALYELLIALGFEARRIAGSMGDTGIVSHGSVTVTCHSRDWLVDSSMLTQSPLPLTADVFISAETVFAAEVEPADRMHIVWTDLPLNDTYIPCRLLIDPATYEYYAERYEASRTRSPFNERVYARRNRPGETVVIAGNRRLSKTSIGLKTEDLSREGLCESLHEDFGISGALIDQLRRSGTLEASFQPPTDAPKPVMAMPPSKRERAPSAA